MENKKKTVKTIAGLALLMFVVDLVSGIILLFITYKEGNHPGFSPAMSIIKSWIVTFIFWKFADAVAGSFEYQEKTKAAKPVAERDYDKEVLEHYTDQRN